MVKRSCPFDSNIEPQKKIHVGNREIHERSGASEFMQQIYGKTLDILFSGAKKIAQPRLDRICRKDEPSAHGDKLLQCEVPSSTLRQLQLNSNGQLMPGSRALMENRACSLCTLCKSLQEEVSCTSCEANLCSNCALPCARCQEFFCMGCTFNMYDYNDGQICRNCF